MTSLHRTLAAGLLVALLAGASGAEEATPVTLALEGRLHHPDGRPLEGAARFTARIYLDAEGGDPIYEENDPIVFGPGGAFATELGDSTPLDLPFDRPYFVGFAIDDGPELAPRLPVREVPLAIRARVAARLEGHPASDFVLRDGSAVMNGPLSMGGNRLSDLAPPTADLDAATRAYVDQRILDLEAGARASLELRLRDLEATLRTYVDRRVLDLAAYARGLKWGDTVDPLVSIRSVEDLERAAAVVRNRTGKTLRGQVLASVAPGRPAEPLAGARVLIRWSRDPSPPPYWRGAAVTGKDGRYEIRELVDGFDDEFRIEMPGYRPHQQQYYGGIRDDLGTESWVSFRGSKWPWVPADAIDQVRVTTLSPVTLYALHETQLRLHVSDAVDRSPIASVTVTGIEAPTVTPLEPGSFLVRWTAGLLGEAIRPTLEVKAPGYTLGVASPSLKIGVEHETSLDLLPAKAILTGQIRIGAHEAYYDRSKLSISVAGVGPKYAQPSIQKNGSFSVRIPASPPGRTRTVQVTIGAQNLRPRTIPGLEAPKAGDVTALPDPVVLEPKTVTLVGTVRDGARAIPTHRDPSGAPDTVTVRQTGQIVDLHEGGFVIPGVPAIDPVVGPTSLFLEASVYNPKRRDFAGRVSPGRETATVTIWPRHDGTPAATYAVPEIRTR